jgi:hypothetical protein
MANQDKEEYSIKLLLENVKVDSRQSKYTQKFLDSKLEEKYQQHTKASILNYVKLLMIMLVIYTISIVCLAAYRYATNEGNLKNGHFKIV